MLNGVQKGVWYHVSMAVDFAHGTATATVQPAGGSAWTSAAVTGYVSGNTNMIVATATSPFYLDNVQVVNGQNPAGQGSVTLADGQASAVINVTPVDDSRNEGDETLRLLLHPEQFLRRRRLGRRRGRHRRQ